MNGSPPDAPRVLESKDILLSVLVAFNFAIAQPVLDLLGRNATFFVVRRSSPVEIVAFALLLCLVIPLALGVPLALTHRLVPEWGRVLHVLVMSVLVALLITQLIPLPGTVPLTILALALAALLGALVGIAYHALPLLRSFVRFGLLGPFAFFVFFVGASSASDVIWGTGEVEGQTTLTEPVPLVMLLYDELPVASLMGRDGNIDASLFPNFARLAETSTWYRNATTVHPRTGVAVPALMTGRYPTGRPLPIAAEHPDNLFARLSSSHRIVAHESITALCPSDGCIIHPGDASSDAASMWSDIRIVALHLFLPPVWTTGLPPVDTTWAGFAQDGRDTRDEEFEGIRNRAEAAVAQDRREALKGFIQLADGSTRRPDFLFGHVMLPHVPYEYVHTGHRYDVVRLPGASEDVWLSDGRIVAQAQARHLMQLGMVDQQLGELLDDIDNHGLGDALLVLTADHGVGFRPGHPRRELVPETVGDVAAVPLFIRYPGQSNGEVDERPVELVDVVPTILDVMGAAPEVIRDLDGVSLRSGGDLRQQRLAFTDVGHVDMGLGAEARDDAVAAKVRTFGEHAGWGNIYSFGPHRALVGSDISDLEVSATAAGEVSVERLDLFANVDPESGQLPNRVWGDIRFLTERSEQLEVLLAIEGRIVTTARTFRHEGDQAVVSAIIPPHAFGAGRHELTMYVMVEDVLHPLKISAA